MTKSRRISNRMVIFTGCLLLLMLAAYSIRSALAIGGWSGATALTGTTTAGVYPDIAVDSNGVIHIVYEETAGTDLSGDRYVKYMNNKSGTFSSPRILSSPLQFSGSANINVATIGGVVKIHVTYAGRTEKTSNVTTHIYDIVSNDGGTTWGSSTPVGPNIVGFTPSSHIDATGAVHTVFGGYEGQNGSQPIINIYYSTNTGSGWSTPQKIASRQDGESYNSFPAISSTYVNNVVTLHVFYMGQRHNLGEFDKWVFSMRKIGTGGWSTPSVRGTTASNFPKLVTLGNNVYATWQGAIGMSGDIEPFYSASADNGASWSSPVSRGTNTSSQGTRPDIARATDNSLMIVWDEGYQSGDNKGDIWSNYSPNTGSAWLGAAPIYRAPNFSLESEVAGSCVNYHTVWHDATVGVFQIFFSQTGPTTSAACAPPATATPTTPPVDFTATRTTASPTKDVNVGVALTNYLGSPNQVRYSATPFLAHWDTPAWQAIPGTNSFSLNVSSGLTDCVATIYVQLRNSTTNAASQVKTVQATVDNAIQANVNIYSLQQTPFRLPVEARNLSGQDNAPDGGDPYYTRDRTFAYTISKEPTTCSGVIKHTADTLSPPAPTYPYSGFGVFMDPFDENPDTNGVLYKEQAVQPTIILTDTLGNAATVNKDLFYDDDPPILEAGGSTSFPIGASSDNLAVTMVFTASVTDDGYQNAAPSNKKYWGAWIVATNTATLPSPATFQQYGQVRAIPVGATSLNNVILVNDMAGMRDDGPRFVHMRFLDGAGNYTEEAITSPQITLLPDYQGIRTYMPFIAR